MPKRLVAFNRRYYNPAVHRLAARLPTMGVMYHTGRRSGREYRTVLNVFRRRSVYVIAIAYGRDSDWVKNVLAKGSCDVVKMGRRLHLVDPRIVVDDSRRLLPPPWRPLLRWLKIADFLVLRLDPTSGTAGLAEVSSEPAVWKPSESRTSVHQGRSVHVALRAAH